jgi:hypothetical protein
VARQGGDQLARRPRHVEEEADRVLDPLPAQVAAERDQVIVLDPDQVAGLDQGREGLGEAAVDPRIALAERPVVGGQVDAVVEQRPQGPVGEAVVVLVDVLLLEVDGGDGDALDLAERELAGELRRGPAAPAEPDAGILAQRGRKRHGQAACAALAAPGRRIHPIGDDQKPAHSITTLRIMRIIAPSIGQNSLRPRDGVRRSRCSTREPRGRVREHRSSRSVDQAPP